MERHDMRMLQARCSADLAKKTIRSDAGRDFLTQNLDGNRPVMLSILRAKNNCHSTATDFALDVVTVAEYTWHLAAFLEEERKARRRGAIDQRVASVDLGEKTLQLGAELRIAGGHLLDVRGPLICG